MRIANGKPLALGLIGLMSVGTSFAQDMENRTEPATRPERAAVLRMREFREGMLASPGAKPAEAPWAVAAPADHPMAPGSFDVAAFVRFVRGALKSSYNKPYKDAYTVLRVAIDNARKVTVPPLGIELCLVGAQDAGLQADHWDDAWEILHTALQAVAEAPEAFSGAPVDTFRSLTDLARRCSWDKTHRNAYHAIDAFLRGMQAHPELFADRYHALAVDAAVASGAKAKQWDDAWRQQDHAMKVLAESDGTSPRHDYLRAGLQGSFDTSHENAYWHLRLFAETLIGDPVADPFDRVTLETALSAAAQSNRFAVATAFLRDAFRQLTN